MRHPIRVLVTGATGFIGRHVLERLRATQVEVAGLARRGASFESDLTVAAEVRTVLDQYKPTHIFHLAGAIAQTTGGVPTLFSSNVAATAVLLGEAATSLPEARIIVLSSSAVYGVAMPATVTEEAPVQPTTAYGLSKAAAETVARCHWDAGKDVRVVRAFNLTGPGLPSGLVLSDVAVQLARGETVRVGNLDSRRDWLDVRDLAEALCLLALEAPPFEVVNVGSGHSVSVRECVEKMVAMADGGAIEIDDTCLRPGDVADLQAGLDRLHGLLPGWFPRRGLNGSLADIIMDWQTRVRKTQWR